MTQTCFTAQRGLPQASWKGLTVGPSDLTTMAYDTKMDLSTWVRSSLGVATRVTQDSSYCKPGLGNFNPTAGAACSRPAKAFIAELGAVWPLSWPDEVSMDLLEEASTDD